MVGLMKPKPKRTDPRFDAKAANAAKLREERERKKRFTAPTPTRGRYYQVTPDGPATVEAIAESVGIGPDLIEGSDYNRSRYADPDGKGLMLGPQGPNAEYPLLWIPKRADMDAPVEDVALEFGCPMAESFRAQKIGTEGGRSPDMKVLDSEIVIEGTKSPDVIPGEDDKIRVVNPNVLAQAIVDIPVNLPPDAADWKVGLSRTIYEDRETWQYEKTSISARMTDVSGGPVLDISKNGTIFDEDASSKAGIAVGDYQGRRYLFETSDEPYTEGLKRDPRPESCTSNDRLLRFRREMDFSVFLLAQDQSSREVCPLGYVSYRQVTEMAVSWANEEKPLFIFSEKGRPEITHYGSGAGHRLPELSNRAGGLANVFLADPTVESLPCDD